MANQATMDYELIWEDPEIYVVRVPYMHIGLDYTNCYIVRSEGETLIIDLGAHTPLCRLDVREYSRRNRRRSA